MANLRWEEGDFIRDLGFRIPEAAFEMEIARAGRTPASHFSEGRFDMGMRRAELRSADTF